MEKPIFGLFATFQKPEEEKLSWSWLWSGFVVSIILFIALCFKSFSFFLLTFAFHIRIFVHLTPLSTLPLRLLHMS